MTAVRGLDDRAGAGLRDQRSVILGTTAAPHGIGLAFGAAVGMLPVHSGVSSLGSISTGYTTDALTTKGAWISIPYEHRHFAAAWDIAISGASETGTLQPISEQIYNLAPSGPQPYTGTLIDMRTALRLGVRAPMDSVAFAAGSGIGVSILGQHLGAEPGEHRGRTAARWHGRIAVRAGVGLGDVQAIMQCRPPVAASYDVHPGDSSGQRGLPARRRAAAPAERCVQRAAGPQDSVGARGSNGMSPTATASAGSATGRTTSPAR